MIKKFDYSFKFMLFYSIYSFILKINTRNKSSKCIKNENPSL